MKIATLKNGALAQGVMNPTATIVDVGVMQKRLLHILTLQIEEINRLWVSTIRSSKPICILFTNTKVIQWADTNARP